MFVLFFVYLRKLIVMKYLKCTTPKEIFEIIFEQIKQFYNVTTWFDYGISGIYIDGEHSLPDEIDLYIYNNDFLSIFDDKRIQNFLHRAGVIDYELNIIQWILIGVCTIYIRFINTEDMPDEEFYYNNPDEYFKYKLESELRELHKFCYIVTNNGYSSKKTVITVNPEHKIVLTNHANYLFRSALKKYCEDHVPDLKGKTYSEQEFVYKNKGGRPIDDNYTTSLMYGTFLMLKSFSKDDVDISDGICRIIYRFLKYLGINTYSKIEENDAIKVIRARIKALQKKSYKPNIGRIRNCSDEELKNVGLGLYNDLL